MGLNIKSGEAHDLARELAELTGESMTRAVTVAVRERRDRVRGGHEGGLADRLLAIGRDTAERLPADFRRVDHGELLYGDDGLPR
jgi:antitoxin VapB